MINGLRAIWNGVGNKFHFVLFTILAALSILLLFPPARETILVLSSLLLSGVIFFLLFALLALMPPVWRLIESGRRLIAVQLVLFLVTALATQLLLLPASKIVANIFIYSGFTVWLILLGLLSCAFAYWISKSISLRSPHFLGWAFMVFAVLLEVGLFYEAFRRPLIFPLLVFYTVAWFAPCIALALSEYHHPNLFQAYSLIALVYTAFPVAYRLFSLISATSPLPRGLSSILSSLPIEEVITAVLLVFALNALGNFFSRHYGRPKQDGRKPASRVERSSQSSSNESSATAKKNDETNPLEWIRSGKEPRLEPFLIFGILFSALAYFAFVHARGPLGIPQYLEPSMSFIISVIAAIPFLIYLALMDRKTKNGSAFR